MQSVVPAQEKLRPQHVKMIEIKRYYLLIQIL